MRSAAGPSAASGGKPLWSGRAGYALLLLTIVYALNIADRFLLATLIEPIKAEFDLSDGGVAFLTGVAVAIFYVSAGIPLGLVADRVNRRNMLAWSISIWSAFTLLCGLSQTYWQLLLARLGVGAGEAGGTPPSQSLLADEFPPEKRGTAMSLFSLGAAIGAAMGTAGAGWLADLYGWRQSLIVFGLIGFPLALLVRLSLREPLRGATQELQAKSAEAAGLGETIRLLWSRRSIFHVLAGATVVTFSASGVLWWTPAFLMRYHGQSTGEAGLLIGMMSIFGGSAILLGTAWAMSRLAPRDPRWLAWVVAMSALVMTVPEVIALSTGSLTAATAALWIFVPLSYLYIGPTLALCQSLVPPDMRGQTVAILLFTSNIANLVIAPQLIGSTSDLLAMFLADPAQSLRWALIGSALTGFWAAWHYIAAAKTLKQDLR